MIMARAGDKAGGRKILTDLAGSNGTTIQNRAMAQIALLGLQ